MLLPVKRADYSRQADLPLAAQRLRAIAESKSVGRNEERRTENRELRTEDKSFACLLIVHSRFSVLCSSFLPNALAASGRFLEYSRPGPGICWWRPCIARAAWNGCIGTPQRRLVCQPRS